MQIRIVYLITNRTMALVGSGFRELRLSMHSARRVLEEIKARRSYKEDKLFVPPLAQHLTTRDQSSLESLMRPSFAPRPSCRVT